MKQNARPATSAEITEIVGPLDDAVLVRIARDSSPRAPAAPPRSLSRRSQSGSHRTPRWREVDSNHRSPREDCQRPVMRGQVRTRLAAGGKRIRTPGPALAKACAGCCRREMLDR
jgi:hypothetical protein